MKHSILLAALGFTAFGAAAQEIGHVLSSVPVIQQVAVPRQVCSSQQVMVQSQPSGGAAVLGAIVGAAIGSQIGHGGGRAAAVGLGAVGGALVGNNVEAGGSAHAATVPHCTTETTYENRAVGWNVTYEYAGRQHTVQMPYDPGPTVRLQVTPIGADQPPSLAQSGGPVVVAPGMYPPPVVITAPAPVMYQAYPYGYPLYAPYYRPYFPLSIGIGYVYRGGHHHHHHHGGHRHRR